MINSELQLSGKVGDETTRAAINRSDKVKPEQLLLIDTILTLPETTLPETTLEWGVNQSTRHVFTIEI